MVMTSRFHNWRRVAVLTTMAALAALVLAGTAAATVDLSADNASVAVGQTVTLTASVKDPTGAPAPDQTVVFTVTSGPNAGLTGKAATDAQGNASFSYSSGSTGTDDIRADWPSGEETSNDTTVTWTAPAPPVTLSASSSSLVVGQTVTLTANAEDPNGVPAQDQTIIFTVTNGPNDGLTAQAVTDAKGNASFSYSSSATGSDDVTAEWPRRGASSNPPTVTRSAPAPPRPPETEVGLP